MTQIWKILEMIFSNTFTELSIIIDNISRISAKWVLKIQVLQELRVFVDRKIGYQGTFCRITLVDESDIDECKRWRTAFLEGAVKEQEFEGGNE